jgi:hypothetical protein
MQSYWLFAIWVGITIWGYIIIVTLEELNEVLRAILAELAK